MTQWLRCEVDGVKGYCRLDDAGEYLLAFDDYSGTGTLTLSYPYTVVMWPDDEGSGNGNTVGRPAAVITTLVTEDIGTW